MGAVMFQAFIQFYPFLSFELLTSPHLYYLDSFFYFCFCFWVLFSALFCREGLIKAIANNVIFSEAIYYGTVLYPPVRILFLKKENLISVF
jgi:hypothetical protein